MKTIIRACLIAAALTCNSAYADSINDAMIRNLEMQRDQAQRNADREDAYGRRSEAYKWQQVADRLQSQIDSSRTSSAAIDDAARKLQDILLKDN